jgi:UDP-N-acetylglucosamine 3-dehydrogenase
MIKVAVIGLGNMGKHHARNYFNILSVNLVAVCDLNTKLSTDTAAKFSCNSYSDYKEMIAFEDINAVSIVVPTSFHKEVALYCMENNIDVLIEKPISSNIEDAQEIIAKSKEKNVLLQVGHIERFNPAVQRLKQIIQENKLGDISSIIARRVGAVPAQIRDTNVVVDLAVHDIDIMNYLYEDLPNEVYSNLGTAMIEEREDYAEIFLKYGKKSGFIQVNWITPVKIRNLIVTGSKGYAELNYITQELIIYESNYSKELVDEYGDYVLRFGMPNKIHMGLESLEPLRLELEAFVSCVETRKEPLVTGQVGLNALRIALKVMDKNE